MRVLVLRPEPQASAMADALGAIGIDAEVAPMLAVVPMPAVASAVTADGMPGALVFTSAAGVSALTADPAHAALLLCPVIAVGPATAAAARRAGFRSVTSADGDGAAAAEAAAALPADGGAIVHVSGRDSAFDVASALRSLGRTARTVVAYRAEETGRLPPETGAALAAGRFDAVVIASARTAAAFGRCLEQAGLDHVPGAILVAISAEAAAPLRPFFSRLVVAEEPNGAGLTKAVVALASQP